MANNKQIDEGTTAQRQSRKDILRARKQEEQLRNIRIGAVIVGVLLAAVILFALVNEYVLNPQREVATVSGDKITLSDWQERVKFERAQRIITLEDQLEIFNDDVGLIQQYSGQTINELQSYEGLGEATLNRMAQDALLFQALEDRGVTISEEEIDRRIEEAYNYYGGESPTPFPTPTDAPEPTPSVTPVGAGDGTDAAGQAPEPQPTNEPVPTATPVSEESFQQEFGDLVDRYNSFGVDEAVYRSLVASSLAGERFLDILAEEQELPEEDVHASVFFLNFPAEEEAQQALSDIEEMDFLTVWNTINSQQPPAADAETIPATASEILWQTMDSVSGSLGPDVAAAIFNTPIDQPSAIIEVNGASDSSAYVIVMPSGRETRTLSDNELRGRKIQLLSAYLDNAMSTEVEIGEYWRSRVPTRPILNPKFLQPPTPTPALPEAPGTGTE